MEKRKQKDWDPHWNPKWATPEDLNSPDHEVVCTCWDITVGDLKRLAKAQPDFKQVQAKSGFGLSCGMCIERGEYLVEAFQRADKDQ